MNQNSDSNSILAQMGIKDINSGLYYAGRWQKPTGSVIESINPSNGQLLAKVQCANSKDYEHVVASSQEAFLTWRNIPAPKRGEIIRKIGLALREQKEVLGSLVSLEMGKIKAEGDGEVQEMIDIADFAVGLSRQLYGLTMHSERPQHRMYEQWHPYGVCGIISAFNFPVAVWSWNAFISAICGNSNLWKPSSKTPLTAIAVQNICHKVCQEEDVPSIFNLAIGSSHEIGKKLTHDTNIPLISFTGSSHVGQEVSAVVNGRWGRTILECGGNNAVIIDKTAPMDIAIPAVVFGAVGTSGQRCTSTRRAIIHDSIYDRFIHSLKNAYNQIAQRIGSATDKQTLMGPLIDQNAIKDYEKAINQAINEGGKVLFGNKVLEQPGFYVEPTIIEVKHDYNIVHQETFAPILYVMRYHKLEEAIAFNNEVKQGLSSALFTDSLQHAETFLSVNGSDCGIANINIGTSGAEIGGAFGGEKETGGGRESGSDSWKAYMRRQTNTINWSDQLPLAQGITFDF